MSNYPEFRVWTPEEEAELLSCLKSGMTYEQTARQINRSVKATKGRYYRLSAADPKKRVERPTRVYKHPGDMPAKLVFMNPHAGALIARAGAKAHALIGAGTAVDAALNMVAQEYGVRLNPDDFALRPVGSAAHRLLDNVAHMARRNGVKARA